MSNYSPIEIDKACLASYLKFPDVVGEYIGIIKPDFFGHKVNKDICSCIYAIYEEKNGLVDSVYLKQHLNTLGIVRFDGELSSSEWIDVLVSYSEFIQKDAVEAHFENLFKHKYLRDVHKGINEVKKYLDSDKISGSVGQISSELDLILSKVLTAEVASEDEPVDIWDSTPAFLQSWKEREVPLVIPTGWPLFDLWYGGLPTSELIVIAAPAKTGKSTVLSHLANSTTSLSNTICLILDTEMDSELVSSRNFQAHTGIHELTARKGKWDEGNSRKDKTNKFLAMIPEKRGKIYHLKVGNKKIEEISAMCKRFYHKKVANSGCSFLLIYDYIKLGSEKVSEAFKEYQVLGRLTDQLKVLAGSLPNTCVLTAAQTNRVGDVASSAQIEWFCSNLFSLVKKTPEQISLHGKKYGNLILKPVRTRILGEEGIDKQLVRLESGNGKISYESNFINLDSTDFKVTERGSYEDILNDGLGQLDIEENNAIDDFGSNHNSLATTF